MSISQKISRLKRNGKVKKYAVLLVMGCLVLLILGILKRQGRSTNPGNNPVQAEEQKVELAGPLATSPINQTFTFPLLDNAGNEVSRVSYQLETAELRDQIIIKGQKASAIKGRVFLILTVKITNDYEQGIQINSKDYVRLQVNGTGEWMAPSIHNDPVEVQAISTKITRLGFTINDTDSNLVVRVGEISGEKQEIPLQFN